MEIHGKSDIMIHLRNAHGGGVTEAEQNEYQRLLREDIQALFGIQTTYDPIARVIQIADQTGDNLVNDDDVQEVLRRVPNFVQNLSVLEAREARELYRELVETLLPANNPQARNLEVALTHINVATIDGASIEGFTGLRTAFGYAHFSPRFRNPRDRRANAQADPNDYDDHTRYEPNRNDRVGEAFARNPNVHRVMGPLFLLLHERDHNVRDTRDPPLDRQLNNPGRNERRCNALRRALGLPRRQAYLSSLQIHGRHHGRMRIQFEHGWVYTPNFVIR